MKKFNLQEYIDNPSRKVVTRDGRKVMILCTDAVNGKPIVALVRSQNGHDYVFQFKSDGRCYDSESNLDLFFSPVNREGWMNIFKYANDIQNSCIYDTKEDAEAHTKRCKDSHYVATIHIEWEE